MKIIDGVPMTGQPPRGSRPGGVERQQGPSFTDVLKKTAGASTKQESPVRVASATQPLAVNPTAAPPAAAENSPVDRIERFLDVLEQYRCQLGDPNCTLKQIQPLMDQIGTEKQMLQSLLEELPEGQPLKDVLNRALVTASTETLKFNRGDYI